LVENTSILSNPTTAQRDIRNWNLPFYFPVFSLLDQTSRPCKHVPRRPPQPPPRTASQQQRKSVMVRQRPSPFLPTLPSFTADSSPAQPNLSLPTSRSSSHRATWHDLSSSDDRRFKLLTVRSCLSPLFCRLHGCLGLGGEMTRMKSWSRDLARRLRDGWAARV
jgi:hypothetical protein